MFYNKGLNALYHYYGSQIISIYIYIYIVNHISSLEEIENHKVDIQEQNGVSSP